MTTNELYIEEQPSLWAWFSGRGDPVLATTRFIWILSLIVLLSAGILGYVALHDLFLSIGLFPSILAYLFPILFDATEVTFAITTLNAQMQDEEDRFAWVMVIVFTLLGMMANVAHAFFAGANGIITWEQTLLAMTFTNLFPISIALVTHNLKNTIKRQIRRNATIKGLAQLEAEFLEGYNELQLLAAQQMQLEAERSAMEGQKTQLEQEIAALKKERRTVKRRTKGTAEAAYAEPAPETERKAYDYLAEQVQQGKRNQEINGAELGRNIGTSESFGRRLKNRLLDQVRSDLEIAEPVASSNGTQPRA